MKNIAIIAARKPSLSSGGEVRNYYLAEGLRKHFTVKVYVPTFGNSHFLNKNGGVKLLYKLLFLLRGSIPFIEKLKKGTFTEKEISEISSADIIQIEELEAFFAFEKYLGAIKSKTKLVLDTHNIFYRQFLSEMESKGGFEKYLGKLFSVILKNTELHAIKKFDYLLICSEVEKKFFSQYVKESNISVIPNGANIPRFTNPKKEETNTIIFMGHLGYQPNVEGLKYYINNIHQKVREQIPDAKLVILGKDAPEWLKRVAKSDPSITLKGFVRDVKPYIEDAKVCICPVLSGSGTRLKILEYMAMGKPVVSTSIGAEGILMKNNQHILLADTEEQFSKNIVKLFTDDKLAQELGSDARKFIKKNYTWEAITNKLIKLYGSLL